MLATFSERGFRVVADNAVDYIAGVQAAGAGHVGANVRRVGQVLHADLRSVESTIVAQSERLGATLQQGLGNLQILSGVNLAVSAAGFAIVAKQLHAARGDLRALHADMRVQGEALLRAQEAVASKVEALADLAARSLQVQEKILDALLRSRTVEAEQLVRQGWTNLGHGYVAEAEERFRAALLHDNTHVLAHGALGELCARREELAAAEDHMLRAARFAGPDQAADARRRLAAYLERTGRHVDALREWRQVSGRTPAEQFHLAELAAGTGDRELGLSAALEALDAAPDTFTAVIGSEALAVLEPERTRRLLEIDAGRREAVIGLLDQVCEHVERVDSVTSYAAAADVPAVRVVGAKVTSALKGLRHRGEEVLREALTAPFASLELVLDGATSLLRDVRELDEAAVQHVIAAIEAPVVAADAALQRARHSFLLTDALPPAAAERVRQVGALLPWKRKEQRRVVATGATADTIETRRRAVADAVNELRSAHAATRVAAFARAAETCGSRG